MKEDFKPSFSMVLKIKKTRKQPPFHRFQAYNKLRILFKKEDFRVINNFKNKFLEVLLREKTPIGKLLNMNNFLVNFERDKFQGFSNYQQLKIYLEQNLLFFVWNSTLYNRAYIKYFQQTLLHHQTQFHQQLVLHIAQNVFALKHAVVYFNAMLTQRITTGK